MERTPSSLRASSSVPPPTPISALCFALVQLPWWHWCISPTIWTMSLLSNALLTEGILFSALPLSAVGFACVQLPWWHAVAGNAPSRIEESFCLTTSHALAPPLLICALSSPSTSPNSSTSSSTTLTALVSPLQ